MCIVMMKPTDPDWGQRGVTVSGALPSQLKLGDQDGYSAVEHGWIWGSLHMEHVEKHHRKWMKMGVSIILEDI